MGKPRFLLQNNANYCHHFIVAYHSIPVTMLLLVVVLHQSLMALLDRKKANEILIPAEKFSRDGFSVQLVLTRLLPTYLKNTRCILFFIYQMKLLATEKVGMISSPTCLSC